MNKPSILFKHTVFSVYIATFIAANFFLLYIFSTMFLKYEIDRMSDSIFEAILGFLFNYMQIVALFIIFGPIVTLPYSILAGWPIYWLARRFNAVNFGTALLGGIFIAIIPFWALRIFGFRFPSTFSLNGLIAILSLGICGAVGGALFYKLHMKHYKKSDSIRMG